MWEEQELFITEDDVCFDLIILIFLIIWFESIFNLILRFISFNFKIETWTWVYDWIYTVHVILDMSQTGKELKKRGKEFEPDRPE